jgi:hypothetical protein
MTTGAERRRARLGALGLFALLALPGCKKAALPDSDRESDLACASACAALVSAKCFDDADPVRAQRSCLAGCRKGAEQSRSAGCSGDLLSYLGCLAKSSTLSCAGRTLSVTEWLDHESGLSDCSRPARAHRACTEPCRQAGVVRTASNPAADPGNASAVQAEVVGLGCTHDAAAPPRKAAAGAPCTHYSVCTAARCECPTRRGAYLARACVAGRCADARAACSVAPRAVAYEPCRRGDDGGRE